MTVSRPVKAEQPSTQAPFVDQKTGKLTPYGHRVQQELFNRTGGFDDDIWLLALVGLGTLSTLRDLKSGLDEAAANALTALSLQAGQDAAAKKRDEDNAEMSAEALALALVSRRVADQERRLAEQAQQLVQIQAAALEMRMAAVRQEKEVQAAVNDASMQMIVGLASSAERQARYEREIDQVSDQVDTLTTDSIPEGASNLYYQNERVDDRVAALIQNGTGISWTYNDGAGTLTPAVSLGAFSTADLAEGANLYFTDARARSAVSAGSGLDYNSGTGAFSVETRTGWAAPSGTATRTTFDTATVTLPQLAERVKALLDDLTTSTIIGA